MHKLRITVALTLLPCCLAGSSLKELEDLSRQGSVTDQKDEMFESLKTLECHKMPEQELKKGWEAESMREKLIGLLENRQYLQFIQTAYGCPQDKSSIAKASDTDMRKVPLESTKTLWDKLGEVVKTQKNALGRKVLESAIVFYTRYHLSPTEFINTMWQNLLENPQDTGTIYSFLKSLIHNIEPAALKPPPKELLNPTTPNEKNSKKGVSPQNAIPQQDAVPPQNAIPQQDAVPPQNAIPQQDATRLQKAVSLLVVYYSTAKYLESKRPGSGSKNIAASCRKPEADPKDTNSGFFTKQDRLDFIEFLIQEKNYPALQAFLLYRVKESSLPPPETKNKFVAPAKKSPGEEYIIEEKNHGQLLLWPNDDELPMDKTIFEALSQVIAAPDLEIKEEFLNRYIGKPESLFCSLLRNKNSSPNDETVKVDRHQKFLLTLTLMSNQDMARKIYKTFVENCVRDDQTHLEALTKANKSAADKQSVIHFLNGRRFFDQDRLTLRLEISKLIKALPSNEQELLNYVVPENLRLTSGTLVEEHYEVIQGIMDYYLTKHKELPKPSPQPLTKSSKPSKTSSQPPKIDFFSISEQVLLALIKSKPFQNVEKTGFFVDLLEDAFKNSFKPLFKAFCQEKRCKNIPLQLLERFRERMILSVEEEMEIKKQLEEKVNDLKQKEETARVSTANDREKEAMEKDIKEATKAKEAIEAELWELEGKRRDLQQTAVKIIKDMNEMIREMKKVQYKPSSSQKGGSKSGASGGNMIAELSSGQKTGSKAKGSGLPGLLDRPNIKEEFDLDYDSALTLTELPQMKYIRSSMIPWFGLEMTKSASPDVAAHILLGAVQDSSKLYLIKAIMDKTNPALPLSFRTTDGFRFYLLFLLMNTQAEDDPKEVSFPHYPITISKSNDLKIMTKYDDLKKIAASNTKKSSTPSNEVEKWKELDERDNKTIFTVPELSKDPNPIYTPTEAFLLLATHRFSCPFEITDVEPEKVIVEWGKSSQPEVCQKPLSSIDGYVDEFVFWLIELFDQSLKWDKDQKKIDNLRKIRSGTKSGVTVDGYRTFFEIIIKALKKYMVFDVNRSKDLINYAKCVLKD